MAIPPSSPGLLRTFGSGFFKLFGTFFKIRFFWLFTLFLLINSLIIGIQANDPGVALYDLGGRFLTPTLELQAISNQIIENQGILLVPDKGFFSEFFDLWGLFASFWVIYLEISVLAFVTRKIILWDDSKGGVSFLLAIFFFLVIQMIYLAASKDLSIWEPLIAFKEIGKAIPYIIKPIIDFGNKIFR